MRLLNVKTMKIVEYYNDEAVPLYAILSHRWGEEEVSLQEWNRIGEIEARMQVISTHEAFKAARHRNDYYHESLRDQYGELGTERDAIKEKIGYSKIFSCAELVRKKNVGRLEDMTVSHVWIDTCCIDKTNHAELSEAINSMFRWYKNSVVCLVHLADVPTGLGAQSMDDSIRASTWFERGWTLQELIAPLYVDFFDKEWKFLFDKDERPMLIESITGIDAEIITGFRKLSDACTAKKMSWAAKRTTTRKEDLAYCLLGIFDVHMPLLYGEGGRAFMRLQEEVIKNSGDLSIFAWGYNAPNIPFARGLFAHSPADFSGCNEIKAEPQSHASISTTNVTLSVLLDYYRPNRQHPIFIYVDLNCYVDKPMSHTNSLFLPLVRYEGGKDPYSRNSHRMDSNSNYTVDLTSVWFQRSSGVAPILMRKGSEHTNAQIEDPWISECRTISIWKNPPLDRNSNADTTFYFSFPGLIIEEVYPPHFCKTAMSLDFGGLATRVLWYPGVGELVSKRDGYKGVAYIKVLRQRGGETSHLVFAVHQPEHPSMRQKKILRIDWPERPVSDWASLADFQLKYALLGTETGDTAIIDYEEETFFDDFHVTQTTGMRIFIKTRGDGKWR